MHWQVGAYRGVFLLIFLSLIILEVFISRKKHLQNYHRKETITNGLIFLGLIVSKAVFVSYQLWVLNFCYQYTNFRISDSWAHFVLAFMLVDFLYYLYHGLSHKIPFLWAFHLVHHSSPWMNLTTAYRLHWLGALVSPLFLVPAVLIGFSPNMVAICISLNLFYQFFLHTELVPKLGLIEHILNTPSNHRVHHASNPEYLDKNFGGIFMIWDKLFGTYTPEIEKANYGITTGFVSHNPLTLMLHGFRDLFQGNKESKG